MDEGNSHHCSYTQTATFATKADKKTCCARVSILGVAKGMGKVNGALSNYYLAGRGP